MRNEWLLRNLGVGLFGGGSVYIGRSSLRRVSGRVVYWSDVCMDDCVRVGFRLTFCKVLYSLCFYVFCLFSSFRVLRSGRYEGRR